MGEIIILHKKVTKDQHFQIQDISKSQKNKNKTQKALKYYKWK